MIWVLVWGLSKLIEQMCIATVLPVFGEYSAHFIYSFISAIWYFITAYICAYKTMNFDWKAQAWKRGFLWMALSNIGDYFLWRYMFGYDWSYQVHLYYFWEGNLKILRVFAQLFAPRLMGGKVFKRY